MYFVNILSQSVACLFIFFLNSIFQRTALFISMKSYLIFVCGLAKKAALIHGCKNLFPIFSSRNFLLLGFTCRPMFHFELILYLRQGMGWESCFCIRICFTDICWKKLSSIEFPLFLSWKSIILIFVDLFWIQFNFIDLWWFFHQHAHFWYCSFRVNSLD